MNLIIDLGNTHLKLALIHDKEIVKKTVEDKLDVKTLKSFIGAKDLDHAIISTVANYNGEVDSFIESLCPLIKLQKDVKLPVSNKYASPLTLGNDRIANAVAAFDRFPNTNVLVVDLGTCVKYDLTTENAVYLGGAISPGFRMRFNALHTFTDKLPLIDEEKFNQLIGTTTNESILSGVYNGMLQEIKGIIQRYEAEYNGLKVLITGGDVKFFPPNDISGKNTIFADEFLTLRGLNQILTYNVH